MYNIKHFTLDRGCISTKGFQTISTKIKIFFTFQYYSETNKPTETTKTVWNHEYSTVEKNGQKEVLVSKGSSLVPVPQVHHNYP